MTCYLPNFPASSHTTRLLKNELSHNSGLIEASCTQNSGSHCFFYLEGYPLLSEIHSLSSTFLSKPPFQELHTDFPQRGIEAHHLHSNSISIPSTTTLSVLDCNFFYLLACPGQRVHWKQASCHAHFCVSMFSEVHIIEWVLSPFVLTSIRFVKLTLNCDF